MITLSSDDGYSDAIYWLTEFSRLYGIKSTVNVITKYVGSNFEGKYLANWNQLKVFHKHGNEIASHSHTHPHFPYKPNFHEIKNLLLCNPLLIARTVIMLGKIKKKPIASIATELKLSKQILQNKFGSCSTFSIPGGKWDEQVDLEAKKVGFSSMRTTERGYNEKSRLNKFRLKTQVWTKYTSLKEANSWVDQSIVRDAWLIENIHNIVIKPDHIYDVSHKVLELHIKYILQRKQIFVTQSKGVKIYD